MAVSLYDLAGALGAACFIVAYFATQQGWITATDKRFPLANLAGAALILFSLWHDWNLPSVIMEGFWLVISVWGLARNRKAALH